MTDAGYDPYNTATRLPALSVDFTCDASPTHSLNEFTGVRVTCRNCGESPPFAGWDDCLQCGTACALIEDPGYLEMAKRTFAHEPAWLAKLEAEWNRQASAFVACGQMRGAA